jgi:glycosyltransferase involved in cell wall biosynthesis
MIKKMATLSIIVITKNESRNIRRCLRSISGWVSEIIVLDSGSDDNTVEICQQFTDQVYITDWPGYGPQKNRALQLAKGDWILSLDADEWISSHLRKEIQQVIQSKAIAAYIMPRLNMFCGKFLRHGDAAKDTVLRLLQRGSGKFTDDVVHEKIICQGKIGRLQQPLLHNSARNLQEWSAQTEKYALLTATQRYAKGYRSNPLRAILHAGWIFCRSYLIRQGFRDGRIGFLYARLHAKSSFQKNFFLWASRK